MHITTLGGESLSPRLFVHIVCVSFIVCVLATYLGLQHAGVAAPLPHFPQGIQWLVISMGIFVALSALYNNILLRIIGIIGLLQIAVISFRTLPIAFTSESFWGSSLSVFIISSCVWIIFDLITRHAHRMRSTFHFIYVLFSLPVISISISDTALRYSINQTNIDAIISIASILVLIRFITSSKSVYILFFEFLMRVIMTIPDIVTLLKSFSTFSFTFHTKFSMVMLACAYIAIASLAYTMKSIHDLDMPSSMDRVEASSADNTRDDAKIDCDSRGDKAEI